MAHYVYKYVLNGEIIYIGKCDADLEVRLYQHGRPGDNIDQKYWDDINSSDIYYAKLANKMMCDVVESELINKYFPKCNKAKKSLWEGLRFEEPEWIPFQPKQEQKEQKLIARLRNEIGRLQNQIALMNDHIKELKKNSYHPVCGEKCKNYYYYIQEQGKALNNFANNVIPEETDGYSIFEIIDMYKEQALHCGSAFFSEAFDQYGHLNCKKIVYVDESGYLRFEYEQYGLSPVKTTLLYDVNGHLTESNNTLMRQRKNNGCNIFYRVNSFEGERDAKRNCNSRYLQRSIDSQFE